MPAAVAATAARTVIALFFIVILVIMGVARLVILNGETLI